MFIERLIDDTYYPIQEIGLFNNIEVHNTDIEVTETIRLYHNMTYALSNVSLWFYYPQQVELNKLNGYELITSLPGYGNQYGLFINFNAHNNFPVSDYNRIEVNYGTDKTSGILIPKESDVKNLMSENGVVESASICIFKLKLSIPVDIINHVSVYQLSLYISYLETI